MNTKSGEKIVLCSVCDTHIPESDVVIKNGKTFCSKEHSEQE
jgi:formylmethanofuran dehydrogenase subunit E